MPLDWDGKIRMDCSSPYAMARLTEMRDRFDVAFANDPDADRHGIVTPSAGLLNPNHYLAACVAYLFGGNREWGDGVGVGKTLVSSSIIDRVAGDLGRRLVEVPVGFKWFVEGMIEGTLGFGGEESAGASFLRRDGAAVEHRQGRADPVPAGRRDDVRSRVATRARSTRASPTGSATRPTGAWTSRRRPRTRTRLKQLSPEQVESSELAGEPILDKLTAAPGNGAPIGGLKVVAEHGWFAARPSGTEDVYKVYAESLDGEERLERILAEAQQIVDQALRGTRAVPNVFGIVLAGGEGKRLAPLTLDRAKPAVPFGGNYRLIDFALSNLVNAGFRQIVVLTQYKSHSLDRHISLTWRLSPLLGNYVTPVPAQMRRGPYWFSGSADAIYQNLNLLNDERPDYVAVFGADHVYRMDPGQMLDQHIETGASVTVAALRAPLSQADQFGVIEAGADGHTITAFREKPKDAVGLPDAPDQVFASMGNYMFTHRGADRRGVRRRRGDRLQARHGRQHRPDAGGERRRARVRLLAQRRPGRERARPRLLARRRDARRLLRRPHGPRLRRPGVQPLQPAVADPDLARAAAAGEVRVRRGRPPRPGARLHGVRGRGALGRLGAPVGALARACTCTPGPRSTAACSCRTSTSAVARSCATRSSTRTCGSPRRRRSASIRTPTASASTCPTTGSS